MIPKGHPPEPPKSPERSALSFGVAVGMRSIDQGVYWGNAPEYLERMGAEVDAPQDAFALLLSQQIRLSPGFAVVFRQRYWAASMRGRFELAPALDWSLNREVLALGVSPAFVATDGRTEFSAGVGPTAYLLRSEQDGHLGDDDTSSFDVGVDAWVSVFFGLADDGASIGAVFVRDWYPLDQVNPLVRDGGDAGGWSAMLGARWR